MGTAVHHLGYRIPSENGRHSEVAARVTNPPDLVSITGELGLVERAQSGDASAFGRLYERHLPRVYALCLRMLSDPAAAEEATQDAFIKAWDGLAKFQSRSAFGTWLHRITVNAVLSARRSDQRRSDRVSTEDDIAGFAAEAKQAMPETRLDLERAIAALPPGARDVLILHDIEGYKYREIAELTGVAVGTVKSQLSRARRLVREELER